MHCRRRSKLERGSLGERVVEERFTARDIEIIGQTALLSRADHVQSLAKRLDASIENVEALLRPAQLHVIPRHLGHQSNRHIAALFIRGLHLSDSGLDIAADTTKPVELPTGVEAGVIEFLSSIAERDAWRKGIERRNSIAPLRFESAGRAGNLRFATRGGDSAKRARLLHACSGGA